MSTTHGKFVTERGEGQLRPIFFPSLATMDEWTGDRRFLESAGANVRELPRPIFAQFAQMPGHMGSVAVGSLQEVTFEDDGNVSGRGWLVDTATVREELVPLLVSKTLFHNSVDLAEVKVRWGSDDWFDEAFWDMIMEQWSVAATTIVGVPAFANAQASLEAPDELTAALIASDDELTWNIAGTTYRIVGVDGDDELTASGAPVAAYDSFHMPEPDQPTHHTVTADRKVYGHIANWKVRHGANGRFCPRPGDYAKFHAGSTLTDRGLVRTGVIFFLGGHPDHPLGESEAHRAYGGVENTWAAVRVTNGRHGPWYCGEALPSLSDEALTLARATPISGHWSRDDDLKAIVSVNVRGFDIPASELSYDHDGAVVRDGKVLELVASLHAGPTADDEPVVSLTSNTTMLNTTTANDITLINDSDDTEPVVEADPDEMSEAELLDLAYALDEPVA